MSSSHPVWKVDGAERERRPGKRYGNVRRSNVDGGVNDMLEAEREGVVEFVRGRMGGGKGR